MCSEAPDMSGANAAALQQAQIGKEALDWYKQLYSDTQPQRDAASVRANAISDSQLALQGQQLQLTTEASQRYKNTFQPVENTIVQSALDYGSPARMERAAGQATADVSSQFDVARGNLGRELAARGVDTSSGAGAIALSRLAGQEGLGRAAASNQSRLNTETIADARLKDAAGIGRGVVSNQAATAGIALNAGNASAGNAAGAASVAASGANLMQAGYQQAQTGLAGSANTLLGVGKIEQETNASNAAALGAIGTGVGMWAGGGFKSPFGVR